MASSQQYTVWCAMGNITNILLHTIWKQDITVKGPVCWLREPPRWTASHSTPHKCTNDLVQSPGRSSTGESCVHLCYMYNCLLQRSYTTEDTLHQCHDNKSHHSKFTTLTFGLVDGLNLNHQFTWTHCNKALCLLYVNVCLLLVQRSKTVINLRGKVEARKGNFPSNALQFDWIVTAWSGLLAFVSCFLVVGVYVKQQNKTNKKNKTAV